MLNTITTASSGRSHGSNGGFLPARLASNVKT